MQGLAILSVENQNSFVFKFCFSWYKRTVILLTYIVSAKFRIVSQKNFFREPIVFKSFSPPFSAMKNKVLGRAYIRQFFKILGTQSQKNIFFTDCISLFVAGLLKNNNSADNQLQIKRKHHDNQLSCKGWMSLNISRPVF